MKDSEKRTLEASNKLIQDMIIYLHMSTIVSQFNENGKHYLDGLYQAQENIEQILRAGEIQ